MTRLATRGLLVATLVFASTGLAEPVSAGARLLEPFKADLKAALAAGMQEGPARAIEACRTEAPGSAARLSSGDVRMGRSSHRLRNPANAAPDWLAPILEDWARAGAQRAPLAVDIGAGRSGYVEPIMLQPLCVTCHGDVLAEDIAARIAVLYPEDRATGFAAGDFRGVFWVEFPRDD